MQLFKISSKNRKSQGFPVTHHLHKPAWEPLPNVSEPLAAPSGVVLAPVTPLVLNPYHHFSSTQKSVHALKKARGQSWIRGQQKIRLCPLSYAGTNTNYDSQSAVCISRNWPIEGFHSMRKLPKEPFRLPPAVSEPLICRGCFASSIMQLSAAQMVEKGSGVASKRLASIGTYRFLFWLCKRSTKIGRQADMVNGGALETAKSLLYSSWWWCNFLTSRVSSETGGTRVMEGAPWVWACQPCI